MMLRRVASAPEPDWLEALLATRFFLACAAHPASPRNECNMFCLDCRGAPPPAFCYYCRAHRHSSHRVIQIRRSSYHDVVRVSEVEDVLDISGVQTYVINSARVLFLNERPQPRGAGAAAGKAAASPYNCEICGRALLDPFRFCSLGCKLVDTKRSNGHAAADTDGGGGAANGNDEAAEAAGGSKNSGPGARPQGRRRKGTPHRAPFWS
ncbi:protein RGF1 INDUCIBLE TRANSCRIPTION FACTOR 1-like [Miscanthus floridulus]|uniref:protein RGF1 INDUCIBLE TRANSCRIPTION FACTOR 1-like n=1 Tax=Miscanthus floridulus TaxID=154761 RepID=UPI0034589865